MQDHVIIEEGYEAGVRRAFNKRASSRLQSLWSDIKRANKCPNWMSEEDYAQLLAFWGNNEDYKKRVVAAKTARNVASEHGGNKHTGGSASRGEWQRKLIYIYTLSNFSN